MFLNDGDFERADWPLLQNGAVNLFWRKSIFEDTKILLRALDYEIFSIIYESAEGFRNSLSATLRWFEQFGYSPWDGGLDALNDGFIGFPFGASGHSALCIENYDRLLRDDAELGPALLDVIEKQSRNHLLHGHTLAALIQTNDANIEFNSLGARPANWNRKEWFWKDRGLA